MPVVKKPDGWWWGSKGPFDTKQQAVAVGQAAHAHGFKEKREKGLLINIDYHNTYTADPKMWNAIIHIFLMRKDKVCCISHDTDKDLKEIQDSIGKVIGKDNCYVTNGKAKQPWADKNGIDVDIWIDNNPDHIINNP